MDSKNTGPGVPEHPARWFSSLTSGFPTIAQSMQDIEDAMLVHPGRWAQYRRWLRRVQCGAGLVTVVAVVLLGVYLAVAPGAAPTAPRVNPRSGACEAFSVREVSTLDVGQRLDSEARARPATTREIPEYQCVVRQLAGRPCVYSFQFGWEHPFVGAGTLACAYPSLAGVPAPWVTQEAYSDALGVALTCPTEAVVQCLDGDTHRVSGAAAACFLWPLGACTSAKSPQ